MERILIIGCSGAGKSTLARALGARTGLPVVHLDQLWWKRGWKETTREDFDERHAMALMMDSWIIDGNYSRTMDRRLERCDTIIYLDFNRWECLWGVFCRVIGNYGRVRPDMPEGCPERFDWEFIRWVWDWNRNNRVKSYTYLAKARHAEAIVLKNRKEVRQFLEKFS